jgi:hypothetical protein
VLKGVVTETASGRNEAAGLGWANDHMLGTCIAATASRARSSATRLVVPSRSGHETSQWSCPGRVPV